MRRLAALALLGGVCHSGKLLLPPLLLAILILAMLLHLSLLNQLRTPGYTVTVATAPFLIPPLSSLSSWQFHTSLRRPISPSKLAFPLGDSF